MITEVSEGGLNLNRNPSVDQQVNICTLSVRERICGVVLCATRQHDDCVDPRQQQHDDKLMDQETHVVVLRRDHFGHVETHVVVLCPTGND